MASLIPGYIYDIFISYRQKDNKGDKWVSKFVESLKTELEATFKEDVSVYFDDNPHDRLQETHNVDKSLEGKLKCSVFIPILSQTYCDPNSYAWQYEFLAFLRMVETDSFGKDVRLRTGNVASRILPIRIHDLEQEDIKLFEKETGTVLRAMDFVFKTSSGVNRPLKADEDHPQDNLNKTFYSDQINKVAHAIKEIILGLKAEISEPLKEKTPHPEPLEETRKNTRIERQVKAVKLTRQQLLTGVLGAAVLIILGIFAFPIVFHTGKKKIVKDQNGKISIAVTNFDNNTNDTTLFWLTKGIPELIRNNLTGSEELSVQNSQTMYELYQSMGQTQIASIAPSLSREAAIKLNTGTYITGSFQKFGNSILTYIKLIDTKSDELLWTGSIEGDLAKYKYLADSLSEKLKDFLEIKAIKQKASREYNDVNTNSPEALKKYVEGMQMMIDGNFKSAAKYFEESYMLDTTFTLAALYATIVYSYDYNFIPAIKWTRIAYPGKKRLPYYYELWLESSWVCDITKNVDSVLYYNDLLAQSDIKSRLFWMDIGFMYMALDQYNKAIKAFEKVETISSEWGGDWKFINYYYFFGRSCHRAGLHDKEAIVYKTGLKLYPDDVEIMYNQAVCAIATGDTLKATGLINKLIKSVNEQKWPASVIETGYGNLYNDAELFDKAEEHYRAALKLDPDNYTIINSLAYLLILHDGNVDEIEKLVKRSLKIHPDNIKALHIQGLVLEKQGKYEEALSTMQKAYAQYIVWSVPLFNDIKKVKAVIAQQKDNLSR